MFNPEAPPEFTVTRWLNTDTPMTLAAVKGRVAVVLAFQMLCPGCVTHALPQARRLAALFAADAVEVIGLHSVFEHHAAMTPVALQAFVEQFGWDFPIAVDAPDGEGLPRTMAAYEMKGTPTLLLFDRQGRLRRHYLGQVDDMRLAAEVLALCLEDAQAPREASVAMERRLAATLVDPHADDHGHHHHDHHHDHDHDHTHHHHGSHDHGDCGCDHSPPGATADAAAGQAGTGAANKR